MISSLLLSSCASTSVIQENYTVSIPKLVERPTAPRLYKLDNTESLNSTYNFKTLSLNLVLLKDYISSLVSTINYYETSIEEMSVEKDNKTK